MKGLAGLTVFLFLVSIVWAGAPLQAADQSEGGKIPARVNYSANGKIPPLVNPTTDAKTGLIPPSRPEHGCPTPAVNYAGGSEFSDQGRSVFGSIPYTNREPIIIQVQPVNPYPMRPSNEPWYRYPHLY